MVKVQHNLYQSKLLIKLIKRSYVTAGPIRHSAVQTVPLPKPAGVFLHPFNLKDKLL